jgi:hypothetical protein
MATYVFNTFGDVIDEAYDILAVDGDSNTFPGLSRTNFNKFANRFNKEFVDSVRLRTQEGTSTFTTVADTSLSADALSGAVTLTITLSTGWPASGLCLVDKVPMTFTRSGSTLTVTATTRAFVSGDIVQLAYAIPSDFWRSQSMFLDGIPFGYQRRGDEEGVKASMFALYGDYIVLPVATAGSGNVTLHYYKKPTATLTSVDTMDIMDMWDNYLIYKLVAHGHGVMYDDERAKEWEAKAEMTKKKARSHFAKLDGGLGNIFIPAF